MMNDTDNFLLEPETYAEEISNKEHMHNTINRFDELIYELRYDGEFLNFEEYEDRLIDIYDNFKQVESKMEE